MRCAGLSRRWCRKLDHARRGYVGRLRNSGGCSPQRREEKSPFSTAPRGQKKVSQPKKTGIQPFPASEVKEVSIRNLLLSVFGSSGALCGHIHHEQGIERAGKRKPPGFSRLWSVFAENSFCILRFFCYHRVRIAFVHLDRSEKILQHILIVR